MSSELEAWTSVCVMLRSHFAELAEASESEGWKQLYLDGVDVLSDVLAAWREEIEP